MMPSLDSIAPIILAAGDSIRMGYPKAILPLGNDLFITRILKTLQNAGLSIPLIVLGRAAAIIKPLIGDWPADIITNPNPDGGQLSSIQLALSCIRSQFTSGMIWPVDQPAVSEDLVRSLSRLFITSGSKISYPVCGKKAGHPAIIHRDLFQEFMDSTAKGGAKEILLRHQRAAAVLSTTESASINDIDTPEDYLALTGESLESALARHKDSGDGQS